MFKSKDESFDLDSDIEEFFSDAFDIEVVDKTGAVIQCNSNTKVPSNLSPVCSDNDVTLPVNPEIESSVHLPKSNICKVQISTPKNDQLSKALLSESNRSSSKLCVDNSTPKRKFPGPAGLLSPMILDKFETTKNSVQSDKSAIKSAEDSSDITTFLEEDVLNHCAWSHVMSELRQSNENECLTSRINLSWINDQTSFNCFPDNKIPVLVVMIKSIKNIFPHAKAMFIDKSDEIQGMIHRKLLNDYEKTLSPGSVLILHQVYMFSPGSNKHYLNVTPDNLLRIYHCDKNSIDSVCCCEISQMNTEDIVNVFTRYSKRSREESTEESSNIKKRCLTDANMPKLSSETKSTEENNFSYLSKSDCSEGLKVSSLNCVDPFQNDDLDAMFQDLEDDEFF